MGGGPLQVGQASVPAHHLEGIKAIEIEQSAEIKPKSNTIFGVQKEKAIAL